MSQIKGFAIRGLLKSLKEAGWSISEVLAAMPPATAAVFDRPVNPSAWYPYATFAALARTVDKVYGKGDLTLCHELGRRAAVRDLGTTFRIISAVTSLEFLLGRLQILWSRYTDTGRAELVEMKENRFLVRLSEFPNIDAAHCASTVGWIEGMGVAVGATGMRAREVRCVNRGDAACEFEGTWVRMRGFFSSKTP